MTTWNYRVIRKTCADTREVTYQIHEVYYQADGSIDCWNHVAVEPLGTSEPALRNDIQSFLRAFRLPVLEEHYINGKAKLLAERPMKVDEDLHADYVNKTTRAAGYLNQILGNHLLLKNEPNLRRAYNKVDQALAELHAILENSESNESSESKECV